MRHASSMSSSRSPSRLGLRKPLTSTGRHAARPDLTPDPEPPTDVIPVMTPRSSNSVQTSGPALGLGELILVALGALHRRVPGGLLVALVVAGFLGALTPQPDEANSSARESSAASSSTASGAYLGTTPLGCDVRRYNAGDLPLTATEPYCTQTKLAALLCDLELSGDNPDQLVTDRTSSVGWHSRAGAVEFYSYPEPMGRYFLCANFLTGRAGTLTVTDEEWDQLISVGDDLPTELRAKLTPRGR